MTRIAERRHAEFLVEFLNIAHGINLQVNAKDEPVDSEVDARASDPSLPLELRFQNVAYRADNLYAKKVVADAPGKYRAAAGAVMSPERRQLTLLEMLKAKRERYPESLRKNLVLLIEITIPSIAPSEIAALPRDFDYGFKAIYFVQLPILFHSGSTRSKEGYVETLLPLELPIVADAHPHIPQIGQRS